MISININVCEYYIKQPNGISDNMTDSYPGDLGGVTGIENVNTKSLSLSLKLFSIQQILSDDGVTMSDGVKASDDVERRTWPR